MHFENKVVWITGASSGIGAALAMSFAAQKAKLILTARNEGALWRLKTQSANSNCVVLPGDMMRPELFDQLMAKAISIYGRIDIVIFCAGQSQRSYAMETEMHVYRELMELNFFAPVDLTLKLMSQFSIQGSGHIVAIGSIAGLLGFPLRTGYAASKHALKGFYESLQTENALPGVDITIISPGRVNTPISVSAVTGNGGKYGVMDEGQLNGIPATVCAQKIVNAIRKKRRHLVIAKQEKFLWWLWWFARPLYYRIASAKGNVRQTK